MNKPELHRCEKHPDKIQYRTSKDAFDSADRVRAAGRERTYVYACDHCGYFHLSKKQGTEVIGRRMASRADGRIWEEHTQSAEGPVRDVRWLAGHPSIREADSAVRAALKAHGNPASVALKDLVAWSGISHQRAHDALQRMGWLPDGATRGRKWTHPTRYGTPAPVATLSEWRTMELGQLAHLKVADLIATMEAIGADIEIRVRHHD